MDLTLPQSLTAEQAALGAIISNPDDVQLAKNVLAVAGPEMFYQPRHEIIATTIDAMVQSGIRVDPQTLMQRLRDSGQLTKAGGAAYLPELMERGWSASNAEHYAADVRDCYRRRIVIQQAYRVVQEAGAPAMDLDLIMAQTGSILDDAQRLAPAAAQIAPQTVSDLLADGTALEPQWVVPGLLARRDRVMFTGFEGLGKSTLMCQVAACAAAGVQPFTGERYEPARVLVIDCENEREDLAPKYRRLVDTIERDTGEVYPTDNLMVEIRTDGLDLTGGDDLSHVTQLCRAARPDLLIIGPWYKLHRSNINDEQSARALAVSLDSLRTSFNVALMMEGHAGNAEDGHGKRKLRPRGSSLQLGWFGIGRGLCPVETGTLTHVELTKWRNDRYVRNWPQYIKHAPDMFWRQYEEYPV